MLRRLLPICFAIALISVFFRGGAAEGADAMDQVLLRACATVTFVEGTPVLEGSGLAPEPVTKGQRLYTGSTIRTDSVSRLELTFYGGGIVRMARETTLELGAEEAYAGKPDGQIQVMLLKGEIWANFSNQHLERMVQVLAIGALLVGPESVFRAAVFDEDAVEVKSYTGQVTASGPFEIKRENNRYVLENLKGGEEGPPEPWRCQITPYRKMIVLASGEASQPFRFAAKSDLTDWVRWNQERDEFLK